MSVLAVVLLVVNVMDRKYVLIVVWVVILYHFVREVVKIANERGKMNAKEYSELMYVGLFLIFPILFFGNQLRVTLWFDVFGVLALVGVGVVLYAFVNMIRLRK
jgi:uncharacterized membrane protein YkvI